MPITNRSEAKESGFGQVRAAMVSFAGDVVSAEFGQWGGQLVDEDTGLPVPPREFLEIDCVNVEVLEVTEELAFIPEEWNFRVNCSDFKGSFWIEDFLASADKHKLLIPDDLPKYRVTWKKVTRVASEAKYNSTNYIIDKIEPKGAATPKVVVAKSPVTTVTEVVEESVAATDDGDPMALALELAVGKTETQFRSCVSLHPKFVGSPLLPMAKAGLVTATLVKEGRLVEVQDGNKVIYQLPS